MGIEQIRMNQTKALPPVPQFNWSQMESSYAKSYDSPVAGVKIGKLDGADRCGGWEENSTL